MLPVNPERLGGYALGSAIANENKPTTTVVENHPEYGYRPAPCLAPALGTTAYSIPPRVYCKPFYSGSQVVYIVSQP